MLFISRTDVALWFVELVNNSKSVKENDSLLQETTKSIGGSDRRFRFVLSLRSRNKLYGF